MTISISMFVPAAAPNKTFVAQSGNSYTSDAYGVLKLVLAGDAVSLMQQDCIPLGQIGALSNLNATTNPGVGNDNTQDYAIGSRWLNKNTGIEYVATSVATGAAVWAVLNSAAFAGLPWVTGQFYGTPVDSTLAAVLTTTGIITAYPIFVPNAVTVSSLNVSVTTGQTGGKCRCALYADTGAGAPGALVAGTDSGDLTATGTAVETKGSLAVALNPGWYWVAHYAAATTTMPSVVGATAVYTNSLNTTLGNDTAADALATASKATTGVSATFVYAAAPATFPSAGYAQVQNASIPVVAIGV